MLKACETAVTDSARQKAEAARDVLLSDAQELFETERKDWKFRLDQESDKYIAELHKTGASALLALTRKALDDLAGETLEERIVAHVVTRLEPLTEELLKASDGSTNATATTRDPLPQVACDRLEVDLQKILPNVTLHFETDAKQSPGLILRMGGAQVAWTVDTYIEGLDDLLDEYMSSRSFKGAKQDG